MTVTTPVPMSRRGSLWIGAAVPVLAALAFFVWRGATPQVHTVKVTPGSLVSTVVATGPVDAGERAEVSARVGGVLEKIQVQEGDRVKAGDVLALQNKTALTTAVVAARAEVARQEDSLVQLTRKAHLTAQQAQLQIQAAGTRLASARAGLSDQQRLAADRLSDAEHALVLLRQTLEGGRNLGADLAVARRKVDDAPASSPARAAAQAEADRLAQLQQTQAEQFREQMAQAQLKLDAARAELARLNDPAGQPAAQVTLAGQELAQLELNAELIRVLPEDELAVRAGLDSARQTLAKAQEDLDAASVKSSISGVVLTSYLKVGEMAGVGTKLFSLASVDPVVVKAKVDESDIGQVAPGQAVKVSSAALPGRSYDGQVRRIAPQAVKDGTATVIIVEVSVPNPDGGLRPGMNADVEIAVLSQPDVLQVVPGALLSLADGGREVFVLTGEAVAARVVTTGRSTRTGVEIVKGLAAGEQVVTGPADVLRALVSGKRVRVAAQAVQP